MKSSQIILIIIGFILVVLIATNPTIDEHKQAIVDKMNERISETTNSNSQFEKLGNKIGLSFGQSIIENAVKRDNYIFFSISKLKFGEKEKKIAIGLLGNVWVDEYENQISEDNKEGEAEVSSSSEIDLAYSRGSDKYKRNDYPGAIQEFTNYLNLIKGKESSLARESEVYYLRAESFRMTGNYKSSIDDCNEYLKKYPKDGNQKNGYLCRGRAYMGLKYYVDAENDFNNFIKLDSSNGDVYYSRGLVRGSLRKLDQECEDYFKAIQLGNEQAKSMYKYCN